MAAAAALSISNESLDVVVGAKRSASSPLVSSDDNKDDERKNKKPAQYNFCCINANNAWTRRCVPITSAAAQALTTTERENQCYPTQQSCETKCPAPPLLPELLKVVLDYEPVEIKRAFDIKDSDLQIRGFATYSNEQIRAQYELNRLMNELKILLREAQEADTNAEYERYTPLISTNLTMMKQFVAKGILERKTLQKIVKLYRLLDQAGRNIKEIRLYEEVLKLVPNTAQLVFEFFLETAFKGAYIPLLSHTLKSLPVISQHEYFQYFIKYEREVNEKLVKFTRQQVESDLQYTFPLNHNYEYFPVDRFHTIGSYFPINFVLAFFQYMLKNPRITLWKWDEIAAAILERLSLEEGTKLLQQLQTLRVASLKTDTSKSEPMFSNPIIQKYVNDLQNLAWKHYDNEIVGVENRWRASFDVPAAAPVAPAAAALVGGGAKREETRTTFFPKAPLGSFLLINNKF